MSDSHAKIMPLSELPRRLDSIRASGKKIVLSHGVYDVLHPGHYRHLRAARAHGDVLVVTITGDDFVGKGPGRPAFPSALRAEVLASLEAVDYVAIVEDPLALPALTAVQPDVYVKGQEYADESRDVTGNIRTERECVESYGGRIAYTDDIVFSSSALINAFMPNRDEETEEWLAEFRASYTIDEILAWIDKVSSLKVSVVGETILDVYTYCEALGKASKEPVLCLNRGSSVLHAGGILAVAGHCAGLGAATTVVTGWHSDESDEAWTTDLVSRGVRIKHVATDPRPTIRKERFVDGHTESRVVEIYTMDDDPLADDAEQEFCDAVRWATENSDAVVVVDYGHGLLSTSAADIITSGDMFLALNVQTNAGNHGFNSLSKYRRADLATMNGHEARLEARHRHVDLDHFIPAMVDRMDAQGILVTQGAGGLDHYLRDGSVIRSKALAQFVKDRVGAGDAVLAAASLLAAVGAPPRIVGFVGNVVGAWAVSFLGNERVLESGQLKRQIKAILK